MTYFEIWNDKRGVVEESRPGRGQEWRCRETGKTEEYAEGTKEQETEGRVEKAAYTRQSLPHI